MRKVKNENTIEFKMKSREKKTKKKKTQTLNEHGKAAPFIALTSASGKA